MIKSALPALFLTLALTACGSRKGADASDAAADSAEAAANAITAVANADSALSYVARQVAFGPRTPGSEAHRECRSWLAGKLTSLGVENVAVSEEAVTTADGVGRTAYNIFGSINPGTTRRVLLLAHYDTRPHADEDPDPANRSTPLDGANDGASGVAVLLDVARALRANPVDSIGVDILLTDLEDSGTDGDDTSWCLGTQKWVENMPYTDGNLPAYGILLDMVGGRDARFNREMISDSYARAICDKVWAVAAASGLSARFPNERGGAVIDDHLYINRAGIPCIDIIENANPATGSFNPTWHTLGDNLGAIDPATLAAVSQVVLNTLAREAGKF